MLKGCTTWPKEFADKYRKEGCWRGETFGKMLRERAEKYGSRIALTYGDIHLSYRELDRRADSLAGGLLKLGIKKNDRVVVQSPNIIEFFEVCFALFRIGALPVFALPSHRHSEITYFCEFSEVAAYIIPDRHAKFDYRKLARQVKEKPQGLRHVIVAGEPEEFEALASLYDQPAPPQNVYPEDVAFLQLSGGSTGLSKLIPRTHDDYIYSLRVSAEICRLDHNSVYLAALPIAHNYPLSSPGVLGTLYAGGRVVLASGGGPDETFPLIDKERVTITGLVPPLALIWLDALLRRAGTTCQASRSFKSAERNSAPKPPDAFHRCLGANCEQVYGMAEGLVNYTRLDDPEDTIVHTQGRPMSPFDEIKIVDEKGRELGPGQTGEPLTRGPYTIRGYYKAEEHNAKAFTEDGFYRTGDLVKVNSSGYLIVEGRAKDQINRGGEKVAAEEVENHLLAHPGVLDAAVVSMPDQFLGERACAYIIPRAALHRLRLSCNRF
nr:AMP-binding protein [Bacillus licheniformis]